MTARTSRSTVVPGRDVAALDLPPGIDRLAQQTESLDDEHTLLVTRTAAPQEAPQSLNLVVREREPSCVGVLRELPWRRRSAP